MKYEVIKRHSHVVSYGLKEEYTFEEIIDFLHEQLHYGQNVSDALRELEQDGIVYIPDYIIKEVK